MEKKEKTRKRIKIEDLPANLEISEEDLEKIQGGVQAFQGLMDPAQAAAKSKIPQIMIGYKGRF